ncbi:hypothetical protein [Bdellovibrio sp. HCB337]|uniref:hypothetical protein n=1 Tax=Bdellovibrio sp. HCB337 TaxID=3394358 RepID=UPI0039A68CD4
MNLVKRLIVASLLPSIIMMTTNSNATNCNKFDASPAFSAKMKGVKKYKFQQINSRGGMDESFSVPGIDSVILSNGGCDGFELNAEFNFKKYINGKYQGDWTAAELIKNIREFIGKLPAESEFPKRLLAELDKHEPALLKAKPDNIEGGTLYVIRDPKYYEKYQRDLIQLGVRSGGLSFYIRSFQPLK